MYRKRKMKRKRKRKSKRKRKKKKKSRADLLQVLGVQDPHYLQKFPPILGLAG